MTEYEANNLSEQELRDIAYEKYKRRVPFSIKKKGLVALLTGKFSSADKDKVFKGMNPDEFKYGDMKLKSRNELKKMFKEKYGFWFPDSVNRDYLEKILEGRLKFNQLPDSVKMQIGKANRGVTSSFLAQFGLDKLPGLRTVQRKTTKTKGSQLSDRLYDKKYIKSKYG